LRKFFERRAVRAVGVGALFVVVVTLLFLFLNWYIAPTRPSDKKDLVLAVAQILGGTALLSGLYFTWRTLQVNREGQITERFTRAIDQLGDESLETRLGGIYALEQIAKETQEYYWPIMQILSSYVKHRAPLNPEVQLGDPAETKLGHTDEGIQAIISILGSRVGEFRKEEERRIDLQRTSLLHTNFGFGNFTGAWFSSADLRHSYFGHANLREASFMNANLRQVVFNDVRNLKGVDFHKANLEGAEIRGVDLEGTIRLSQDQIEWTIGSNETQLPENLNPPELWSKSYEEQVSTLREHFGGG
jgi:hypothetical protein